MRFADFLTSDHRRTHKWYQYFPIYERHFERFRNRFVTLFEIGIGEGGSLQLWKRHLGPFARIVGMDIHPMCKQVEEDQIHVRTGSQDDTKFLADVVAEFGNPDIVIDDGSHHQDHVNKTFEFLYPLVAKNGLYLVEDLHAAYWPGHGAGLRHENSFIERAKNYVDEMHAEYTGGELPRTPLGDRTTSIHFYDSVIVLEVGEHRTKGHTITGNAALFRSDWSPDGPTPAPDAPAPAPAATPAEAHAAEPASAHAAEKIDLLQNRIAILEDEISRLRGSTSWKVTEPLRTVGRMVKR